MEQANTPPAVKERPRSPGKTRTRVWLTGCVADLVIILFLLCVAVILIAILLPALSAGSSTINVDKTKSTLRKEVNSVEQYATDIDGLKRGKKYSSERKDNGEIRYLEPADLLLP